jgi:hypothetical protein
MVDATLAVQLEWGRFKSWSFELVDGYAMQGDTAKAKPAYQDFLTLWKDADPDPDIAIVMAAKSEYAS